MSKETKEDRVVRTMLEQVIEHIFELKNLEANSSTKESDIERWAASFLKNCLGYTASASYSIKSQESKGRLRPDLIVSKNDKNLFLVEVKKLGFDFDKSDFRSGKIQLTEYLNAVGNVRFGMLTNGPEWRLYDFGNPQSGGIEILRIDLKAGENDTYLTDKKSCEDLCYELIDFHEFTQTSNMWPSYSKEASAFSPDSIAKALLSLDTMKVIAKQIKGEHELKTDIDSLIDKVYFVIEKGLNEAIPQWNDAKSEDFKKYIKAQKRASKRTKRPKRELVAKASEKISDQNTPVTVENKQAS